jgi:hypothetical protein
MLLSPTLHGPERDYFLWVSLMKYLHIIAANLIIIPCFFITKSAANPQESSSKLTLNCETKSRYFSYADINSYIKDLSSHSKELYSENFLIEFQSSDKATKKHANDKVEDEDYSAIKNGSLYRLKLIKGTDDISIVIDLKTGNYYSVSEKPDAMIRIKATGTCVKN